MKKILIITLCAVFALSILVGCERQPALSVLTPAEAQEIVQTYINEEVVDAGSEVEIIGVEDENGLYKVSVKFKSGTTRDSYMSKDGKIFFPEAWMIDKELEAAKNANTNTAATQQTEKKATATDVEKMDKPTVDLFVMSHCPFGTQIEKGIMPVIETLGDTIDFELKFVNYAMHDKKEIDEQLNQYCIQKDQNAKFLPYLECFLKSGDGTSCLSSTGINTSAMNTCVSQADQEFKITENYNDKSTWRGRYPPFMVHDEDNKKYGVEGSPALVLNGLKIATARSPQALLSTICAGFTEKPSECSASLDTANPSAGFGEGTGGSGSGGCGG